MPPNTLNSRTLPARGRILTDNLPTPQVETADAVSTERRVKRLSRRRLFSFGTLGWSVNDGAIAFISILLGYGLSPVASQVATSQTAVKLFPCAFTFALLLLPTAHVAALHDPRKRSNITELFVRCLVTTLIAMSALALCWMLFSFLRVGRYVFFISSLLTIVSLVLTRCISWNWSSTFKQRVCFLGTENYCVAATQFVDDHPLPILVTAAPAAQTRLRNWAVEDNVDEIVFDASLNQQDEFALLDCLDAGVKVSSYTDFIEEKYNRIPVENIDAKWLFSTRLDLSHPYYQGVKRLIDLAVATAGLICATPLIIVAAIAIKVESKGPIFYSQVRTGRFGRSFRIYKLRTMAVNSEVDGAQWAEKNDVRVTAVGRVLRKTRLDELPQFFNVLKSEMSLIGPRPERPEFAGALAQEIPFYQQRHLVKPGLSGWAQVNYPYGASVEDAYNKLTFDFYYIKNASLALDLQIVLRTIGTVMKGSR